MIAVDSLFDASLFDAEPSPPAPPSVGVGQLDIFGNAVEAADVAAFADVAHVAGGAAGADTDDAADTDGAAEGDAKTEAAAGADTDDADDPDEAAEIDDPGDVLNDPNWEPPIDDDDVATTSRSEEVDGAYRGPSVDGLWSGVIGQDGAVDLLRSAAQSPVHAYLFVGPAGSGRRSAARSFATALLCPRGGCGACDVCTRALAAIHPDLVEVERDGASISVDQAREIIRLAMRSPLESDRKVIVLIDFHLVANAAPTLLKIIEEPPPSTVFVVLADQLTNELVTIASRCVEVRFAALSFETVVDTLVAGGVEPDHARRVARASGGRLDRAQLLVNDEQFQARQSFWENAPRRLDGTGASVAVIASEALAMIDNAATGPLEARHAVELKALEERIETTAMRGGAGLKKDLGDRQKRELKRLRDDELRFGLSVLQQMYRTELSSSVGGDAAAARGYVDSIGHIGRANVEVVRNPNINLLLASVLLKLAPLREAPTQQK